MPWHCPACQSLIRHGEHETKPRLNVLYRCHVCRLELTFDAKTETLRIAPMTPDEPNQKSRTVA